MFSPPFPRKNIVAIWSVIVFGGLGASALSVGMAQYKGGFWWYEHTSNTRSILPIEETHSTKITMG
jgi:hypothetical protein